MEEKVVNLGIPLSMGARIVFVFSRFLSRNNDHPIIKLTHGRRAFYM